MKLFRVFLLPNGEQWCDFPIPENATAQTIWPQVMADGVVTSPQAIIPRAQIHHALVLELQEPGNNLSVFPGGKSH